MKRKASLLFLVIVFLQINSVVGMDIVAKIETYLDQHPEYEPQPDFVTAFIFGESKDIVHASVQPDLTTERILQNGDVHSFNRNSYSNIVIPTNNIRAVYNDGHDFPNEMLSKQGKYPADQLAIYTSVSPRFKKIVSKKQLSSALNADIVTADISFSIVNQLIASDFANAESIFPEKTPQDTAKLLALLKIANKSFSNIKIGRERKSNNLSFLLKDLEEKKSMHAEGICYAYEIYSQENGDIVDRIVWLNMDAEEKLKEKVPFDSATLAVHKDKKRLHAFIKGTKEIPAFDSILSNDALVVQPSQNSEDLPGLVRSPKFFIANSQSSISGTAVGKILNRRLVGIPNGFIAWQNVFKQENNSNNKEDKK